MKVKSIILPVLFTLILAAITFLLTDRFVVGLSIPRFSFLKHRSESAYTVAEEIGDLYLLNTSEYRLKMIFPHDFVDRDLSWWAVKEIYERGQKTDDSQKELIEIYKACLDGGFDPAVDVYDFIVFTAVVKAGINISGTAFENPELHGDSGLDRVLHIEGEGAEKKIALRIPEAEITELYIDDRRPDSDNFPDAEITPAQWRDLVDFLNPRIRDKVVELGILDDARENSRTLITKLLRDNGFVDVTFSERNL